MEFKAVQTERGEAFVKAVPSHPDGHFLCDVLGSEQKVTEITLRDVKQRHIRALTKGNASAMRKYVVTDPVRPDITHFMKCLAEIPDTSGVGGVVTIPEVIEVSPDKPHQVYDAYQAIGEWWAQRLLHPILDTTSAEAAPQVLSPKELAIIEPHIGPFARALARYSEAEGVQRIATDYHPDGTLRQVAGYVGLSGAVFSLKSFTHMHADGTVTASEGFYGEEIQIWPPLPEIEAPVAIEE